MRSIAQDGGAPPRASRIALIVPCYNEAQRLNVPAFREYLSRTSDCTLVFVDDGSTDNTREILRGLVGSYPGAATMLCLAQNGGKAEAVRRGMLHALEELAPEYVGFWDADLATPLETVARFEGVLDAEPAIEMVFGARIQLLGRHVQRSAVRHYLGRIFATVVSVMLKLPIYDTQCGAKLFRVRPETRAIFAEAFASRWVFDVEIIARYQKLFRLEHSQLARAIYEYPLESWVDVGGSKVKATDFFRAFWDVVKIRNRYLA